MLTHLQLIGLARLPFLYQSNKSHIFPHWVSMMKRFGKLHRSEESVIMTLHQMPRNRHHQHNLTIYLIGIDDDSLYTVIVSNLYKQRLQARDEKECWQSVTLTRSPFQWKKPVEWQLFIMQLSVLLKIVRIHWINWAPKPKDFNVVKVNECSMEWKAFSKSAENRIPPILFLLYTATSPLSNE